MIRHIVSWNGKDDFSDGERAENIARAKVMLEGLRNCVPGIAELTVVSDLLPGSNADLLLDSLFDSEEALAAYKNHPDHLAAGAFISRTLTNRRCVDYRV